MSIMKVAVCVFVLLGVALAEPYTKYNEFGCLFEDKPYKLRAPEPIWDYLPGAHPWRFEIHNQFQELSSLENVLKEIFKEVMEESILNDVDQFIEFIQAYQNQPIKQDLKSFFRNYTVPFRPQTDSAGIVIEVFKRLKLKLPNATIPNHFNLITAYVNPNVSIDKVKNQHKWPRQYDIEFKLTKSWFQKNVAGVITVELELLSGYFLLDPLHGSGSPVLLLREKSKQTDGYTRSTNSTNNFEFTWTSRKNPFIVAENKGTGSPGVEHILYFVDAPYCSFMDSTTKGALLLPEHKIEKRNATGGSVAYLRFQVQDNKEKPYFTVGVYNSSVTGGFEEQSVTFEDVQQGNISQNARTIIKKISAHLKIEEEVIISKMVTLQEVLFQHDKLLNEIFQLQTDLKDKASLLEDKPKTSVWKLV